MASPIYKPVHLTNWVSIPAELAVFFSIGGRSHRQYSVRLAMEGYPG